MLYFEANLILSFGAKVQGNVIFIETHIFVYSSSLKLCSVFIFFLTISRHNIITAEQKA